MWAVKNRRGKILCEFLSKTKDTLLFDGDTFIRVEVREIKTRKVKK